MVLVKRRDYKLFGGIIPKSSLLYKSALALLTLPVQLPFEHHMFRLNWLLSSGVQFVGEIPAPLSLCYTLHFKCVKYL
jgi:hypothetical protein